MSLAALEKKRATLQRQIVKTQADIIGFNPATVTSNIIEITAIALKEYKVKLDTLFEETFSACKDDDEFDNDHDAHFDTLFKAVINLQDKIMDLQKSSATRTKAPIAPAFKLERIKMPQFTGSFHEWPAFRDLFIASVDQNPTLSGAEKLIHLKTCLKGEAAAIINSFSTTSASYAQAWASVLKRFDNKREIIFAIVKRFDEHKGISTESSTGIRSLADILNETVRSLRVQAVPVEHWDLILVYFGLKKLDPESRKQWSLVQDDDLPTLDDFINFLENRARALHASLPSSTKPGLHPRPIGSAEKKIQASHHTTQARSTTCVQCNDNHPIQQCPVFRNCSVAERRKTAAYNSLCFNCLSKGHGSRDCKLNYTCSTCNKKHNSLLHQDVQVPRASPAPSPTSQAAPSTSDSTVVSSTHCTPDVSSNHVVLMGTLVVTADDSTGAKRNCRVFVDPGSEVHFISEQCVDFLGLNPTKTSVSISGISGAQGEKVTAVVNLKLFSRFENYSLPISALVLKKITGLLPRSSCSAYWPHLQNIKLSDAQFHRPGSIDILLGAAAAASIMLPQIIHGPIGTPTAQRTQFGWMLSGSVKAQSHAASHQVSSHPAFCNNGHCPEVSLEKFWTLEEPDSQSVPLSKEDEECEQHFLTTHTREADGSYTVELPFRKSAPSLGHSRSLAIKRLTRMELQFPQRPELQAAYVKGMRESAAAGFIEAIPPEEVNKDNGKCYYMPHHMVVKDSSSTTKFRICFDASAKTLNNVSLNDTLLTGTKLQVDLVPLLIRFRSHLIAMSADITKFYHQFRVVPHHADFQRFVWRESPQLPITDYRMVRLTFGVTSAPFLAIRCLHQLADDEKSSFPSAVAVLKNDFLVDNLLSGANDVESALALQKEVQQVMARGKLQLCKWSSNHQQVLDSVPPEQRDTSQNLAIQEDEIIRTIGLLWNPKSDTFGVSIVVPDLTQGSSKRKVLSSIARIFDPLGWLSPVTVKPKALMQELWKAKLGWDSPLPHQLHLQWISYCKELKTLEEFKIPRCFIRPFQSPANIRYELHGFSDACKLAYSACVYVRAIDEKEQIAVTLVAAKTKVAPIKSETIPRLELCGAVLLARLMKTVRDSLKLQFHVVRCWTDATIVLDWLVSSEKLPVFVTNRKIIIEDIVPSPNWNHVSGEDNPADCASRGISAAALIKHPLWLQGPPWLSTTLFPSDPVSLVSQQEENDSRISLLIEKNSSFSKLRRVTAYCLRFIHNSHQQKEGRQFGPLTALELSSALIPIVRCVQEESFKEELRRCSQKLPPKSNIKFLSPFLDHQGILRVGGRLRHSTLSYGQKHPILLPRNHHFTEAIVRHFHLTHLHAAPQLLLSVIRDQFWIVRGPDVVRHAVRKCVTCHRNNSKTATQLMGQLPSPRVTPSRPFSHCGVDYAGPFLLCLRPGRNPTIVKAYVSVFVCMVTHAVHLEHASDLSTPAFIAALTRFISRRGCPTDLYSDRGTNFVGAKREMDEFLKLVNSTSHQGSIINFAAAKGITSHFNPPSAPHHGGLWEAAVKSMKAHLKRVLEDRKPSLEEFVTLLYQVEACLNSRPLTAMSSDPNDFNVLTPGHFLIGDSLTSLPQPDLTHLPLNRLSRWQAVQQMTQHFWRRWMSDYLSSLQSRPKWFSSTPNIQVGTLVLVRDDDPTWGQQKWKLARVSKTFPGHDQLVRVCEVTLANGTILKRPIVKLSLLPITQ